MAHDRTEELEPLAAAAGESPLHGYRGLGEPGAATWTPPGLTIAISREAGSRGAPIATRAAEKLGWEVYSQDLMEYISQDPALRHNLVEKLPQAARAWVDDQLARLVRDRALSGNPTILDLARLMLELGAQGNVVLLGRGAGFLLPSRTTLHVRLIAPLDDRIAYMSQWQRLTADEAAEMVRTRDQRRTDFVATHFHRKPNDPHAFDMVLNTSLLGEERCADLIASAAKAKMSGSADGE